MSQLWEGTDSAPWTRKLSGRTKLLVLLCFSLLVITIDNPRTLFLLFTATLGLHLAAKTSLAKWQVLAVLLLLSLWGSIFSQALFYNQLPRTPLFILVGPEVPFLGTITGGIAIYREGLVYGAIQGLRSATMLTLGLLICWTSDPRQLLQALLAWGLSPQLAFMLVTAIRFLPVLAAEAGEVMTALRLRSADAKGRKSFFRHLPYLAKPLLARCLRRSQTLALSVVSRGFFLAKQKSRDLWPAREKLAVGGLGLVTFTAMAGKFMGFLADQGYYFGLLRYVYDWSKLYL